MSKSAIFYEVVATACYLAVSVKESFCFLFFGLNIKFRLIKCFIYKFKLPNFI